MKILKNTLLTWCYLPKGYSIPFEGFYGYTLYIMCTNDYHYIFVIRPIEQIHSSSNVFQ